MSELKGLVSGAIGGGIVALLLRKKIRTKYTRIESEEITEEKIIKIRSAFAVIHFLGNGEPITIEITKNEATRTIFGDYETIELIANQEITIKMKPFEVGEIRSMTPTIEIIEILVE
ncbi:MAG: hypothetical protein QXR31_01460 [Zestosphaera sp.]